MIFEGNHQNTKQGIAWLDERSLITTDPTAVPTSPHLSLVIQCLRVKSQLFTAPRSGTAQRNQDPDLVSVYPAGTAGLRSLDSCNKGVSWNGRSPSHHGCHGRMTWVIWGYRDFRKPPFFRSPCLIGKSSVNGPFSITMLVCWRVCDMIHPLAIKRGNGKPSINGGLNGTFHYYVWLQEGT